MKKAPLHLLIAVSILAAFPQTTNANDNSIPEQLTDLSLHVSAMKENLPFELSGRYISGADFGVGGAEIVAYDERSNQIFSVNGNKKSIDILDGEALTENNAFTDIPLKKRLKLGSIPIRCS
ncbi:hypothetical protein [Gracilibacillus alcaliphilus]|uniref:hypothetical protein n=1 Tax=Gracilibacillus alcaliphilus TaxID=1401441 RepID=UPI00195A7241|nr:hypothetical protein [Gracilibacillus alcaliphilus]MBM7676502.1 hypothetical protein [Gracilibacillus alcaliphilus]